MRATTQRSSPGSPHLLKKKKQLPGLMTEKVYVGSSLITLTQTLQSRLGNDLNKNSQLDWEEIINQGQHKGHRCGNVWQGLSSSNHKNASIVITNYLEINEHTGKLRKNSLSKEPKRNYRTKKKYKQ